MIVTIYCIFLKYKPKVNYNSYKLFVQGMNNVLLNIQEYSTNWKSYCSQIDKEQLQLSADPSQIAKGLNN